MDRLPWYSQNGENFDCFIIGIAGASASGKTSVSHRIIQQLGPQVVIVCLDSFYKPLSPEQIKMAHASNYNFDHADAFDLDLCYEKLKDLKAGKYVEIPNYDFSIHNRTSKVTPIYGVTVVIFEGIFALYDKKIRDLMDLKLFVDTDADVCLARRLKRDIVERGRDTMGVLTQYKRYVKPMFEQHVLPTMRYADIISPRGKDNVVAIDLIAKHIKRQLNERGIIFRSLLNRQDLPKELPSQVVVLPQTSQLMSIHTIIRDRNTLRTSFVFYIERLSTILVEYAMNYVPIEETMIKSATEKQSKTLKDLICGVCVIRGGSALESGLRHVVKDAPLGRILIQTDPHTGEPKLHYRKFPPNLKNYHVFLLDAGIASGSAGLMAIRVLLDHNVPEDKIVFIAYIAAPQGVHAIANAFPKVKIVISWVDPKIDDNSFELLPGLGNFSNRYFGT